MGRYNVFLSGERIMKRLWEDREEKKKRTQRKSEKNDARQKEKDKKRTSLSLALLLASVGLICQWRQLFRASISLVSVSACHEYIFLAWVCPTSHSHRQFNYLIGQRTLNPKQYNKKNPWGVDAFLPTQHVRLRHKFGIHPQIFWSKIKKNK